MTSNVGSHYFKEMSQIGFGGLADSEMIDQEEQFRERVQESLKQTFKPEFLNRIDETIIFHPLTRLDIEKIVDIRLDALKAKLADRDIKIAIDTAAKKYLVENGFSPEFGARPLNRLIQKVILDQLADRIIKKEIKDGDRVKISFTKSTISITA